MTDGAAKTRVMIVEDHPIFREGLAQLINRQRDLEVCAEATDAREAVAAATQFRPEVVLLDLTLKGVGGLELLKELKTLQPKVPVLVLTMNEESLYAERALRAGASGYLMKQEASGDVVAAIRTVLVGEMHMSRALEITLMRKAIATPELSADDAVGTLTDRELQIFELIGASVTTREISKRLGVSIKTVETHRENIKRKLALANGAELLTRAQSWVRGTH